MKFSKINFLKSSLNTIQCPKSNFKEIAFIGRSNVGKSSLINMLFNNKNLAKISKKPGKTKLINHFMINDTILLADLPGYGYAKLSKVETKKINEIIQDYIENRKIISLEGNLLRFAINEKISRDEFIKFYVGNEINPNLKSFLDTNDIWKKFFQKYKVQFKDIRDRLIEISNKLGLL